MAEPEVGGEKPIVVELADGTYWWCACGRSKNQPFCDGSHAGSEFAPLEWKLEQPKRVALCTCKRTDNQPLCDGSHARMSTES